MSTKKCIACDQQGVLLYVCDDCAERYSHYKDLCAEKEAEIGEQRDIIERLEAQVAYVDHRRYNWEREYCRLVEARDIIVREREEARAQLDTLEANALELAARKDEQILELEAQCMEARQWAEHYIKAADEANDALLEHDIDMHYSDLPLTGIPPWRKP